MRALQSGRHKKGIYSVITTFILVITVLVGIGMLFLVNNTLLGFKEGKNIDSREKYEFKNINERLFYCYGNIINTTELIDNLECMNLKDNHGFSIRKLQYLDCPGGVVKELNFRGTGMIERYYIPIYHTNNAMVCPAELTIYQNAGQVPLILNVTLSPSVGVQGTDFAATINFFHTVFPSYFNLSVVNGEEVMRIDSGALGEGTDQVTLDIASSGLEPGLYRTNVFATHDGEFIDIAEDIGRFRVVNQDDEPVLNTVDAPLLPSSIWDMHNIEVNLSDYVDIVTVQAVIIRDGSEVDRIDLARMGNKTNEELKTDYIYTGTWDSSGMLNQDAIYNITIVAINDLGNTMQTLSKAAISIEAGATGLVLIFSNNRVDSSLGSALDDYRAALTLDGYASEYIRLDSNDVTQCDSGLTPASGPTVSANDALLRIPSCIAHYESEYSNQLDDSTYVLIIGGHNQIEFSMATGAPMQGFSSDYYTDDYFADLNGSSFADRPIGRLPDGISGNDNTYVTALQTATRLHNERGWQARGTDYLWTLDIPRGAGSPTAVHIECINYALDSDQTRMCGDNPNCYFSPPYNQGVGGAGPPPGWTEHSDMLYICGHGYPDDPTQNFEDHEYVYATMGDSSDIAARDMTDTIFFYNPCWGGRTHNVDPDGSVVLQALLQGAAAVFGGTSSQGYYQLYVSCTTSMPLTVGLYTGSTYMANLAYEINRQNPRTIGDAWLKIHNQCTDKMQREMNVMYGDPSIRVK